MNVPFVDLSVPTQSIKTEYLAAVENLLAKGLFILSEDVERFEREWAAAVGVKHCVGVSNGADAIYVALAAAGVGPGDEVITQGTAYNASVTPILRLGAVPRFADILADTLTIDSAHVIPLINDRTKAILPVHLYGQPCDMDAIMAIARDHGLAVVEDCAQAHGAAWRGKKAGSYGDAAAFSFYPTKNLGAFGDAGAVVTDRDDIADAVRTLRNLGQAAKDDHRSLGFNMRLDAMQALCLSLKLPRFGAATQARIAAGEYYDALIRDAGIPVRPVMRVEEATHVYHLYVVQLLRHDRAAVRRELAEAGVETGVHYPLPVYRQPFWKGVHDSCPVTDEVLERIVSLPMYAGITREQQEYVIETLKRIMAS